MLRITPCINSAAARRYFESAFSVNDYYAERGDHQEVIGKWGGKGAERLGLVGDVDQERFDLLVENIDPNTHRNLTPRFKEGRRCGYDFTLDLSKGLSIYYALTKDERVMVAFDEAANETMKELEADTRTRVRTKGQNSERITSEMTWASFDHFTARPVGGGVPDPHVHRHVFVFNQTWDAVEGRWKALDVANIKMHASYYQEAFHSRVASKLRAAGLMTERNAHNYDLAGFDRATVEKFSHRTEEIERIARENQITDAAVKSGLGATTRQHKQKDLTLPELRQEWDGRLDDAERKAIGTMARGLAKPKTADVSAGQAVDYALGHCFERASVTSEKRLLAEAIRHGLGSVTVEEVWAEVRSRPEIIVHEVDGQRLATTREVIAQEESMIAWARDGRGSCFPLVAPGRAIGDERLNQEQQVACRHVWESTDRVILVRGVAGAGKTTLMTEVVAGIEAEGGKVFAFAPSAKASRDVLRSEGFGEADTVARLLQDTALQERIKGGTLWVDEAGTLGVRSMNHLFELADEKNCRIILTGDSAQTGPVERGESLHLLETRSGLRSASVSQIKRQTNEAFREAVMAASRGDVEAAYTKLDELGFVKQIEGTERHGRLAADYLDAVDKGKSALVVAPTHAECHAVTREIRAGLRERGMLQGEERSFLQLRNLQRTEAEKGDAVHYDRVGDVVQLVGKVKGFERAERLAVVGRGDDGSVMVERAGGEIIPLPLDQAGRFQHYEAKTVSLAVGDRVRYTQNGYTKDGKHRLNNGDDRHTIAGWTRSGDIKLDNGWIVDREFAHITHGYTSTAHASQGRTVDRCFVAMGSQSFAATNSEGFYVSISRARESVTLYTDDSERLRHEVAESGRRMSALEMVEARSEPSLSRRERLLGHAELNARLKGQAEAHASRSAEELREQYGQAPGVAFAREEPARGVEHER